MSKEFGLAELVKMTKEVRTETITRKRPEAVNKINSNLVAIKFDEVISLISTELETFNKQKL